MTLGEILRYVESRKRVRLAEAREQAARDYILADLIGESVSRCFSSSNKMREIYQAYPHLFDSEEIEEQRQSRQDELSALNFIQFAKHFNQQRVQTKEVAE